MGKTPTWATGSPRPRGFTLVELLVVLAILVGLSAAFPLAWQRFSPQRQLQVYARRLQSDLRLIRAQAMETNTPAELSATLASLSYSLGVGGPVRQLPEAITLQILNPLSGQPASEPVVRFYPDGSSSGATLVLRREGRNVVVTVSALSGKASLQ